MTRQITNGHWRPLLQGYRWKNEFDRNSEREDALFVQYRVWNVCLSDCRPITADIETPHGWDREQTLVWLDENTSQRLLVQLHPDGKQARVAREPRRFNF